VAELLARFEVDVEFSGSLENALMLQKFSISPPLLCKNIWKRTTHRSELISLTFTSSFFGALGNGFAADELQKATNTPAMIL
jgi:dihydroorotase